MPSEVQAWLICFSFAWPLLFQKASKQTKVSLFWEPFLCSTGSGAPGDHSLLPRLMKFSCPTGFQVQ